MMNQPPIDQLAGKTGDNKYKLCCLVSKRAKELEKRIPAVILENEKKAISMACDEVVEGKIVPSDEI